MANTEPAPGIAAHEVALRDQLQVIRLVDDKNNPFTDDAIQTIIDDPENLYDPSKLSPKAYLLLQHDINKLEARCSYTPQQFQENIERITDEMPKYLEGMLGGVGIFGARHDEPGMRYVGVGYPEDKALHAKIKKERVQILEGLNARILVSLGYTPFISLFKTPSQDIASDVAQELRKTGICGELITFGAPSVTLDEEVE